MQTRRVYVLFLIALAWSIAPIQAKLSLALPFGDNAVLQHGKPLPIWGTADSGAKISVTLGGKEQRTTASDKGQWKVEFPASKPSKAGTTLAVKSGKDSLVRKNLLFGDVWIATGQSNMRWTLKQSEGGKAAIAKSADEGLRLMHLAGSLSPGSKKYPLDYLKKLTPENYYETKGWKASSPATSAGFSGVGYFFAKKLRSELDIPIGVIQLAVGGTPIEAHMPRDVFESDKELKPLLEKWWSNSNYPKWCRGRASQNLATWNAAPASETAGLNPPHPFAPTFLWDAGIKPLTAFPVKGVIWYQGESNAGKDGAPGSIEDGALNKKKFKLLIQSWRKAWADEKLPVYYAQLPGLNRKWPVFREMQLEVSQEVENVGMAVTIDHGHPTNVHPSAKLPVGNRLARLALAGVYEKDIVPNGPIVSRHRVKGEVMLLSFKNGKGLKASDGGDIKGFEVAGEDKKFFPATVTVKSEHIEVKSAEAGAVKQVASVRYAWANNPNCNLVNAEGLPASPFRTDRWKEINPSGHVDFKKGKKATKPKKNNNKIRVACVGDSITYGAKIKGKENTYPAQLQKLLGDKYEVRNFGNPGRGIVKKSMRGKTKRAYIFMKEHKAALEFEPHIVICNLGINDLGDWNKFGKDTFEADYQELLQSYKTLGSYPRVIIWNKLAPLFKGQKFYGDKRVDAINNAIANVAKLEKVDSLNMEAPLLNHPELFPDFIHPNAKGAKIIAEVTAKFLKE